MNFAGSDHHAGKHSDADLFIDQHTSWNEHSKYSFIPSTVADFSYPPIQTFTVVTGKSGVNIFMFGVN